MTPENRITLRIKYGSQSAAIKTEGEVPLTSVNED